LFTVPCTLMVLPVAIRPVKTFSFRTGFEDLEEIRDNYLSSGVKIQESVCRDLDVYFKNIRIGAIGDKLNAFREWRESLDRVV